MKQFMVIFNKQVVLPGDNREKFRTYGILFNKSEKSTFDRVEDYIRNYILPIAELFREGIEHIDEYSYRKDGEVFYTYGPTWQEYVKKAERRKIRFAVIDDENIKIKTEDFFEDFLLLNKERWMELKTKKDIEWH